MKASELMIGNYVYDEDGSVERVATISANVVLHNEDLFSYIDTLKPIPLTKEWLEKFGFKKEHSFSRNTLIIQPYFYMLCVDVEQDNNITVSVYDEEDSGCIYFSCDYVHELQNLYRLLTGTELKTK